MKTYPSIPFKIVPDMYTYVFDKLDGSNIRAEWSRKKGFYKFGSRTRLLGEDQGTIWQAKQMILDKFGEPLSAIFKNERYESAVAFFEFHGPFSFAGMHEDMDTFDVTLIDVAPYKKGILVPSQFLKLFGHLDTPRVLHRGLITTQLVTDVKEGTLDGMTHEGVVCKGVHPRTNKLHMYKIKNRQWVDQLKEYCGSNTQLFKRLL